MVKKWLGEGWCARGKKVAPSSSSSSSAADAAAAAAAAEDSEAGVGATARGGSHWRHTVVQQLTATVQQAAEEAQFAASESPGMETFGE